MKTQQYIHFSLQWTEVYCFLFTDLFLICKASKRSHTDRLRIIKPPMRLDMVRMHMANTPCEFCFWCVPRWSLSSFIHSPKILNKVVHYWSVGARRYPRTIEIFRWKIPYLSNYCFFFNIKYHNITTLIVLGIQIEVSGIEMKRTFTSLQIFYELNFKFFLSTAPSLALVHLTDFDCLANLYAFTEDSQKLEQWFSKFTEAYVSPEGNFLLVSHRFENFVMFQIIHRFSYYMYNFA